MRALLQKDKPWIVVWAVVGCIALAGSLAERSFLDGFVMPATRHEALFHAAWICGLLLGGTAACFDEVLGVREYLWQRPVSVAQRMRARLVGLGIVLLSWFLLAPTLYVVASHVLQEAWSPFRLMGFVDVWKTLVVALPAAAIGLFAGSLPSPWWLRLLVAATCLVSVLSLVGSSARLATGYDDWRVFGVVHLAIAVLFTAGSQFTSRFAADLDLPLPRTACRWGAGLATGAFAAILSMALGGWQVILLRELDRLYPAMFVVGQEVRLVSSESRNQPMLVLVGDDHLPTAEPALARQLAREVEMAPNILAIDPGFDAPRWGAGWRQDLFPEGMLILGADGRAWFSPWQERQLRPCLIGDGSESFGPGSVLVSNSEAMLVRSADRRVLHRWDSWTKRFLRVNWPADVAFERVREVTAGGKVRVVLCGEGGVARLMDGTAWMVPFESAPNRWERRPPGVRDGFDPVDFTRTVARDGGRPEYNHAYTPRRLGERLVAGMAMAAAALRAPVLDLASHLCDPARVQQTSEFDPLVAGRNRLWLVCVGFGVGALCALRSHRRLRRLGAAREVQRFWSLLCVLFGPAALVASFVFERPRAYLRLPAHEPVLPPRILTRVSPEEVVA